MNDPWFVFLLALAGGAGAVLRYVIHAGFGRSRAPHLRASAPSRPPGVSPPPGFPPPGFSPPPGFLPPPGFSTPTRRPSWRARAWADADWRLFAINIAASFVAGFVTAAAGGPWGVVLATGLCGGASTWSTLMNDARIRLQQGRFGRAFSIVALSVACSILAAWLGYALAWLVTRL